MMIQLPEDLESSVRADVLSGHFASEDDLVAAAVRAYFRQPPQSRTVSGSSNLGSIEAMHGDAELLGEVTELIMQSRETRTLRLPSDESESPGHRQPCFTR